MTLEAAMPRFWGEIYSVTSSRPIFISVPSLSSSGRIRIPACGWDYTPLFTIHMGPLWIPVSKFKRIAHRKMLWKPQSTVQSWGTLRSPSKTRAWKISNIMQDSEIIWLSNVWKQIYSPTATTANVTAQQCLKSPLPSISYLLPHSRKNLRWPLFHFILHYLSEKHETCNTAQYWLHEGSTQILIKQLLKSYYFRPRATFLWNRELLCSWHRSWVHYVAQAGLKFKEILLP